MKFFKNHFIANIKFRELLLPTILMATANNMTVFVDSVITSRLCGDDRLAAIQITAPLESLMSLIIWSIGIGGSLICFERKANNKSKEGDQVFTASFSALLMISLALCILIWLFKDSLLTALCPDVWIRTLAGRYLDFQALTFVPAAYIMGMAYFMRADDCAMLAFVALVTSNIVNLCMDIVYIKGFGMDIRGASLATLTGLIVASFITTIYFFRDKRTLNFNFSLSKFFTNLRDVVARGFPASAIQLYALGRVIVVNRVIAGLSSAALVAYSIFNSSLFIPSIMYVGIAQTMSPLVSFFYQEKDYNSVRHVAKKSLIFATAITAVMAFIVILFPSILTHIFNTHSLDKLTVVFFALRILPASYIGLGLIFILTFYLQALGKLKMANTISFFDGFAISALLVVVLSFLFGIPGSWGAIAFSQFVTVLAYALYTNRKKNGFFLLPIVEKSVLLDVSVDANPDVIMKLSETVQNQFCNGVLANYAHFIAQIIEELALKIIKHDSQVKNIDIAIRKTCQEIIISIRDIGKEYNLSQEYIETKLSNTESSSNSAVNIAYCRVTGINCTAISIKL